MQHGSRHAPAFLLPYSFLGETAISFQTAAMGQEGAFPALRAEREVGAGRAANAHWVLTWMGVDEAH